MLVDRTSVLLILPRGVLDRARVVAGRATTRFKLPVSLQIVLRALLEQGLKRDSDPALLANIEGQARAVRQIRSTARRRARAADEGGDRPGRRRGRSAREAQPPKK